MSAAVEADISSAQSPDWVDVMHRAPVPLVSHLRAAWWSQMAVGDYQSQL